jgi:hypothetical protein
MKRIALAFSFIIALSAIVLLTASSKKCSANIPVTKMQQGEGIAVLELFTSQGCSSCPPADELLGKYATGTNKNIIALAFHVDYWNRLGWIDSFSNAAYSQRQRDYATRFNSESVYTPQLVINGEKEMVGSETGKVAEAVDKALQQTPTGQINITGIAVNAGKVNFSYTSSVTGNQIVALLVQHKALTQIRGGENKGVQLTNYNVVRDMVTVNDANGKSSLQLPAGIPDVDFSIVVMAQDKSSGKINGAVQVQLPGK